VLNFMKPSAEESPKDLEAMPQNLNEVEVLEYGAWTPEGNRSVLLTIESDAEVDITSELGSTVGDIHVKVGEKVAQGQKLLTFKTTFDQAAINYQNAIATLESTRMNNTASIESSKIALENAESDLDQTYRQELVNFQKSIESLRNQTKNTENSFSQALNLMDKWLGVSNQYRSIEGEARAAVGGRDRVGRLKVWNEVQALQRDFGNLLILPNTDDLTVIFEYGQDRLNYARKLQTTFNGFEGLVRGAVLNQYFNEADLGALLTQVTSIRASMNGDISSLSNILEEARTAEERKNLSILSAENRYRNAQTSYELGLSGANNQITNAENQLRVASISQNDLIVRAPFAGIISEKFINIGAQVNRGTALFKLTNPESSKKGVAFLSITEYQRLNAQSNFDITVDDQTFSVEKKGLNARIDPKSQKMRVEFILASSDQASFLVGQIGRILLPSNGNQKNTLPLSAISFEPDGAEVLVVDGNGLTRRQKVQVGKLRASAIEVIEGLSEGDLVVQYRSRSYAGQKIKIKKPGVSFRSSGLFY
ncbi:MAG TPA: HlyD family efflux transporter periplasmic adaptor subunit, partial [Candidatus Gracilibacteria bacterium]